MPPRSCRHHPDSFCYICGNFTTKKDRRRITENIKKLYAAYFSPCKIGDQEKPWAPHICCKTCQARLCAWVNKGIPMPFGIPMMWREQRDHFNDCYFCKTEIKNYRKASIQKLNYPCVSSAIRPIPHSEEIPMPTVPENLRARGQCNVDSDDALCSATTSEGDCVSSDNESTTKLEPRPFSQADLNDLMRDMNLSISQSELLASRLQERNLLEKGVKVTFFRQRTSHLMTFFSTVGDLCFCNDISGLFNVFQNEYNPTEWRLFIDGSVTSIKAVLLHIGNLFPSVPIA